MTERSEGTSRTAWTISLFIGCGLALAGSLLGPWTPDGIGLLLVGRLMLAALVAAVLWGLFRLFRRQGNAWVAFGLFAAMIVAGSVVQETRERAQFKLMALQVAAVAAQADTDEGVKVAPVAKSRGDFGKLELIFTGHYFQLSQDRRAYQQELAAAGWTRLLEPERVLADQNGEEGKAIVARVRALIAKYGKADTARAEKIALDLRNADVNPNVKRGATAGLDETVRQATEQRVKLAVIEIALVDRFESAERALQQNRAAWQVQAGQFVFLEPGRRRDFDDLLVRILKIPERLDTNALKVHEPAIAVVKRQRV
jgi:hypothetical protein